MLAKSHPVLDSKISVSSKLNCKNSLEKVTRDKRMGGISLVQEGFLKEVTADLYSTGRGKKGKYMLGTANGQCKDPGVGICLMCFLDRNQASVAEAWRQGERDQRVCLKANESALGTCVHHERPQPDPKRTCLHCP
jgi:hypothetical protein